MTQERTDTQPTRPDSLSASKPAQRAERAGNVMEAANLNRGGTPSSEERADRIAKSAYARAQQRSFAPGYEWDDWFSAEREIDAEIQALMSRTSLPGS